MVFNWLFYCSSLGFWVPFRVFLCFCFSSITSSNFFFLYLVQFGWRKRKLFRKFVVYSILDHRLTDEVVCDSFVCVMVLLSNWHFVFIQQSTQSRFHTIIHFCSALFILFPSLSKTKAQLSLCLYTLQMNAYPCKFLKKKGWEFEYFA